MALRSLCSLVRGATRARTCSSSSGIALQWAPGSGARSEAYALKDLPYHVYAHPFAAAAAAAISPAAGSSGLQSRAAIQAVQNVLTRSDGGGGAGQGSPGALLAAATISTFASCFFLQSGSCAEDKDELPDSIDWSERGAVTPVKQQDKCGNCYAHSTVGAIEGLHKIKTGKLVELSIQQVTDCAKECNGCKGGRPVKAFLYCCDGLATSKSYPQRPDMWHGICRSEGMPKPVKIDGYAFAEAGEEGLMRAVAKQPVVVTVDATPSIRHYRGGIITLWTMPEVDPKSGFRGNHTLLVVGYGTDKRTGKKYWKVKNSWGRWWGEKGYARIERGTPRCKNGVGGILRTRGVFPYIK